MLRFQQFGLGIRLAAGLQSSIAFPNHLPRRDQIEHRYEASVMLEARGSALADSFRLDHYSAKA